MYFATFVILLDLDINLSQTRRQSHQAKVNLNSKWQPLAACRNTPPNEDFFDNKESALKLLSRKYCLTCPVRTQCLYMSLINEDQYGLWGSLTPKQRRYYLRQIYMYADDKGIPTHDWSEELDEVFQLFSSPSKLAEHFYL